MQKFVLRILHYLEQLPLPIRSLLIGLLILFLGLVDIITGFELSFSLFYVLPVSIAAWTTGKKIGYFASCLSGFIWFVADLLAGQHYTYAWFPYWNASTRILFFIIIAYLLAELRQALDTERTLARTDNLTGVLNRRAFYQGVLYEVERFKRFHFPLTLVYIDLDNFKTVNDERGHQTGDQVLARVAHAITTNLRTVDTVARLGGDEFAILLPQTDEVAAKAILPRLHWHLNTEMERHQWPVTISMGALTCRHSPISVEEMINEADQLMYKVKHTGKDNIAYHVI